MTTMQQLIVGVFRDRTQAEQAINELHQAGFDHRQIRFAGQGVSTGGIIDKIKSVFIGQDIAAGGVYDDLVDMGTPPEDAHYYQSEFEAGHSIVTITGTGVPLVAINILARYGGYGAKQRSDQAPEYDKSTDAVQEPTTEGVNAELNGTDGQSAQTPEYEKGTDVQEPTSEDVNAEPYRSTF